MAKAIRAEDIEKIRKNMKEIFISQIISECKSYVNKYISDQGQSYSSFSYKKQIPAKYKDIEIELYSRLKDVFPDFIVVLTITKKKWFCYWTYYEVLVDVKWD